MTEKEVARWQRKTKHGKAVFISQNALIFFLVFVGARVLVEYVFAQRLPNFSWFEIVLLLFLSIVVGFSQWWNGNGKYQSYLLDQRIQKGLQA